MKVFIEEDSRQFLQNQALNIAESGGQPLRIGGLKCK